MKGRPIEEIHRRCDLVRTRFETWHGATPTTAMTHIAIQEKKDGKVVELDGARYRRSISETLIPATTPDDVL